MCCLLLNLMLQEYDGYQNWLILILRLDIGEEEFIEMQMDCLECQWILRSTWIYELKRPLRSSLKLQSMQCTFRIRISVTG